MPLVLLYSTTIAVKTFDTAENVNHVSKYVSCNNIGVSSILLNVYCFGIFPKFKPNHKTVKY